MDSEAPKIPEPPDLYIGKKAVELGLLTARQLAEVLTEMSRADHRVPELGETLVSKGLITRQQLGVLSDLAKGAPPKKVGRYHIVRELGRGGMGVVYEAQDPELGRCVALKMLLPAGDLSREDQSVEEERFTREARLSANLPKHPHIVGVYEAGVDNDRRYIAMEFVEGRQFSDWRRSKPLRQQIAVLRDAALAVDHAHRHGIIHRDLKPANILVDAENRPHVTDFGLAKRGQGEATFALTMSGAIMGTPAYMSPEQASGRKEADARIDVWALGVMLYEILTGRVPFEAETALKMIMKTANEPVTPPSTIVRGSPVDRGLESICMKALSKQPERRHASAKAFSDDLTRWIKGDRGVSGTVRRPSGRAPGMLWGGIAAAVVAAVVAVVAFSGPSAQERAAEFVAEGQQHLARKKYSDALISFGKALGEQPGNREALAGKKEAEDRMLAAARAPVEDAARKAREEEAAAAKQREAARKELEEIDGAIAPFRATENFSAARDLLVQMSKRREELEWKTAVAARLDDLRRKVDEVFAKVQADAIEDKKKGDAAGVDAARARVAKWKWAATAQELDDALAKVSTVPPPITLTEREPIKGNGNAVQSLSFSPDGRTMLTNAFDGTVRLFDVVSGAERAKLLQNTPCSSSSASPDGKWYAAGGADSKVRIWDSDGLRMRALSLHGRQVTGVAFTPDSSLMLTSSVDGTYAIWDPATGSVKGQTSGHPKGGMSIAVSADGRLAASGAADMVVHLWDLPSGRERRTIETGPDVSTISLAFTPDGKNLIGGNNRGEVTMWEVETGKATVLWKVPKPIRGVAVSPDGRLIASASAESLKVWDRVSPGMKLDLRDDLGFFSVAFSRNGGLLAGGSAQWTVRIWEIGAGKK